MKKFFILTLILFSAIFMTGCSDDAVIMLKSEPFNSQNYLEYEHRFKANQRIYYAVLSNKGFKDTALKIQVFSKNTKAPSLGYSYKYGINVPIDNTKKYYTDYIVMTGPGLYIMQVFELGRPDKCLARQDFWVE